jgi:hypothetical protein
MFTFFSFLKNLWLKTLEPDHYSGRKESLMGKVKVLFKYYLASVADIITALGVSLLASGGPLA